MRSASKADLVEAGYLPQQDQLHELLGRPRDVPFDEQNSRRRQEIEVDGSEVYGAHD
jgi:hypothetical protein